MFPGPNTLHVFKPRSIYKATGGGILEKFGKSAIKTVKKIINKIDAIEVCKIMYFCDKNDKDLVLPEVRKDPKDVCHDCMEFYADVKILAEMNVGKLEKGIEKGCSYITYPVDKWCKESAVIIAKALKKGFSVIDDKLVCKISGFCDLWGEFDSSSSDNWNKL